MLITHWAFILVFLLNLSNFCAPKELQEGTWSLPASGFRFKDDKVTKLKPGEVSKIKSIWKKVTKNKERDGKEIVKRFLNKFSQYVELSEEPNQDLEKNQIFRFVVDNLMKQLGEVVNLLDKTKKLKNKLNKLGKNMKKIGRKKMHYVNLKNIILDYLHEKYKTNDKQASAINRAFDMCLPWLFEGFGFEDEDGLSLVCPIVTCDQGDKDGATSPVDEDDISQGHGESSIDDFSLINDKSPKDDPFLFDSSSSIAESNDDDFPTGDLFPIDELGMIGSSPITDGFTEDENSAINLADAILDDRRQWVQ